MAKAKRRTEEDEFLDDIQPSEGVEGDELTGTEDLDAEALKKEIAALRAEVASLRVQTSAPRTETTSPDQRWLVSLVDGVSWVVAAPSEADAVRAYKAQVGMISTANEITCSKTDLPLGRFTQR